MYSPPRLKMEDTVQQHQFIEGNGFGIIVSSSLTGTHLPFHLNRDEGQFGTLYAHCARVNPHWQELQNAEVMVIFSGPHSYISPSWYSKPPAVPTWNYTAVHAYGTVTLLDADETLLAVENVVNQYEPALLEKQTILTPALSKRLLPAIVGFKITLSKLQGKIKLGQQKNSQDQENVYHALSTSARLEDQLLAKHMLDLNIGIG